MTETPEAAAGPKPASPRVVLFWLVIVFLVAVGVYAIAPWVLPARIIEGPLVQMAGPERVELVWYTTRPVACDVVVLDGDAERVIPAAQDGRRLHTVVDDLAAGTEVRYEIRSGSRPLTKDLTFQTSKAAGKPFAFLVLGDSGKGNRLQYAVAEQMRASFPPPDFVLHTGDVVYPDGARRRYRDRFFSPYRHLLGRVNFWPCLGNHDVDEGGTAEPYTEVFELPTNGPVGLPAEHSYWFDYADCRVAVIDSNPTEEVLTKSIAPWLREVMAAPGPRWRFVSLHHPPYTGGKYQPDLGVQRALVPVFEETGVDVVFCGHDHMYQRLGPLAGGMVVEPPEGVLYIISAAGGARLYEAKEPRPEYVRVLDNGHRSFTQVLIDGDELTLRQIASDGEVIDEFSYSKSEPVDEPASQQAVEAP